MRIVIVGVVALLLIFLGFSFIVNDDKEVVIIDDQELENNTDEETKDNNGLELDDNKGIESMTDDVTDEKTNISEETSITIDQKTEVAPVLAPAVTPSPVVTPVPEPKPELEPEPEPKISGFTLGEVAKHNDSSSCWTVVNGSVYDVTPFIKKHPGGAREILEICGIDGTKKFSKQHGGDSGPENTLKSFYIGKQI